MIRTQIYLTEEEQKALRAIANSQDATQSEVIREAIDLYIVGYKQSNRLQLLREARGIWADREDIDAHELRAEWNRQFEGKE